MERVLESSDENGNGASEIDARELIKKVRRIELYCNFLVESMLFGSYRSRFRGQGMEFSEVREYREGDDVRMIDWNVTARMGHPFVKEFIEERDMTVYVLLDVSGSLDFGTQDAYKRDVALELVGSIAFAALKNNDRMGLVLSSDRIERHIAPAKGKRHVLRMMNEMCSQRPKGRGTDLKQALEFFSKILSKRSIIFIVSDFMDDIENISGPLKILARKHDLIAVDVSDLREEVMPDVGLIELEDEETGEQLIVDTSDPEFLESYSRLVKERQDALEAVFKSKRVDYIRLNTRDDWYKPVVSYFSKRKKAGSAGRRG